MSVISTSDLNASPLSDLHVIAGELGIDGYRRLRKAELIEAINEKGGGASDSGDSGDGGEKKPRSGSGRSRRGGGGRSRERGEGAAKDEGRTREREPDRTVEGVVELNDSGTALLRIGKVFVEEKGKQKEDKKAEIEQVFVSAAQARRCELLAGDVVTGPIRPPRRTERYPSLIRVLTVNGNPPAEVVEGARIEEMPAKFPTEALPLKSKDATISAIASLTPIGKGSRAVVAGPAMSGKSETLRRLADTLAAAGGDLELMVALCGVRPEEMTEWSESSVKPAAAVSFAAPADAQSKALERVVDQAKRLAVRGKDVVLLVDGLDQVYQPVARKTLAAARNLTEAGSLTLIGTTDKPFGGETTVIVLDSHLAQSNQFPAIDLKASGTLRPELLVSAAGMKAIITAKRKAR